jgi:tellurite resistance protein TerC
MDNSAVPNPGPNSPSTRQAAWRSLLGVSLEIVFAAGLYIWRGPHQALDFVTAYVIELSLSLDNLVMFALIFSSAGVALQRQSRVLFWGILGALITRGVFVFAGVELISHFHWFLSVLGVFVIAAGARLLFQRRKEFDVTRSRLVALARAHLPLTPGYEGGKFFVREGGRWLATPLLLVLLAIEITDVIFALDSVPAVFSVTQDAWIVYSSNILAVIGLRALYFLLADVTRRFRYLRQGMAVVLAFVGSKMLISPRVSIPAGWSLFLILAVVDAVLLFQLKTGD